LKFKYLSIENLPIILNWTINLTITFMKCTF